LEVFHLLLHLRLVLPQRLADFILQALLVLFQALFVFFQAVDAFVYFRRRLRLVPVDLAFRGKDVLRKVVWRKAVRRNTVRRKTVIWRRSWRKARVEGSIAEERTAKGCHDLRQEVLREKRLPASSVEERHSEESSFEERIVEDLEERDLEDSSFEDSIL
jgi:hypothetical protein